jgi:hypothetical protein
MSMDRAFRRFNRRMRRVESHFLVAGAALGAWVCGLLFQGYPVASMIGAFVAGCVALVVVEDLVR